MILFNATHFQNNAPSNFVTFPGIVIFSSALHPANVPSSSLTVSGMTISAKEVQFINVHGSSVIFLGSTTSDNASHPIKHLFPNVTFVPVLLNVTVFRLLHPENASSPTRATMSGITSSCRPEHSENASCPISSNPNGKFTVCNALK